MRSAPALGTSTSVAPCILVVDDDRRVVELLQLALAAHGFRVVTAGDGDEALKVALSKRPDLIVLDVRLPKRSGLEVCEMLRQDPDDPHVPVIMVSAAAETEARIQGLARGADDYLAKPFSPKELIARIQRLLVRSADAREARRRGHEAERELARARDEARRAQRDLHHEQRLRAIADGVARELHCTLDPDALADRLLLAVQHQVGAHVAGLLWNADRSAPLAPYAIRGDGRERLRGLTLERGGELAQLLGALDRPARWSELERFPELRAGVAPFVARGLALLAPLRGMHGLEALVVANERPDAREYAPDDLEALAVLCGAAAVALRNAGRARVQAERTHAALVTEATLTTPADVRATWSEASDWLEGVTETIELPETERAVMSRALALGSWALAGPGAHALAAAALSDVSGLFRAVSERLERSASAAGRHEIERPHEHRSSMLLGVARVYAEARARRMDLATATEHALAWAGPGLDDELRDALLSRRPVVFRACP